MKFALGFVVFMLTLAGRNEGAIILGVVLVVLCAHAVWKDRRKQ